MKKKKGNEIRYAKYGYIFAIPFVVAYLIFQLYPILYTIIIGFTDLQGVNAKEIHFLEQPFDNFRQVLTSATFKTALSNTVIIWMINFVPQILLALLLTAWFTDRRWKIKGQGVYKVLLYMPNIITAATIAILFNQLFAYPTSPINDILTSLKIISETLDIPVNS